jgi:hypothetical protein
MSSSSCVGAFDLNEVKLRKPLEFPDGTIQASAYTGSSTLVYYNNTPISYPVTQPLWSVLNSNPNTVEAGLYQATIQWTLVGHPTDDTIFDYFEIGIGSGAGGAILIANDYTPDWTLKAGDNFYKNTSLTFVNPVTQNVSLFFTSATTSPIPAVGNASFGVASYILTKLANLPP